ncbi:MAG: tripartite tricarboxylate transporter permease [Azospirillaceae bacterium]
MSDILTGLASFGSPEALAFMLAGIAIGCIFGLVPGLSGLTAIALLLPFVYGMDPGVGLSFLLATHAVVNTGGSLTAILVGIPGAPSNTATVLDGYPMAQRGEGGRALGAALTASAIGGVLGSIVLIAMLPVLQPIVLYFQSPETFMIAVLGVTFIAVLGSQDMVKGLLSGALGMFLATFGYHSVSGVPRFWLDIDQMLDGFPLIPVALGLFAIPEIVALGQTGGGVARRGIAETSLRNILKGAADAFVRIWLVVRASLIGVFVGLIPGLGGETAPWMAYAAAKATSRKPEEFGHGSVEGVIAPEACNNSKEGGALVPTLAFGIPGSSAMAILIGAFFVLGLEAGPQFLRNHMDIAVHLSVTLAVANIVAAVLLILLGPYLARVTVVPGRILAPLLMVTLIVGTYSVENNLAHVLFLIIFGVLGFLLKEFKFNRPALLLGFVLAPMIETYMHIASRAHGWTFIFRPLPLAILVIILLALLWPAVRRRRGRADR